MFKFYSKIFFLEKYETILYSSFKIHVKTVKKEAGRSRV